MPRAPDRCFLSAPLAAARKEANVAHHKRRRHKNARAGCLLCHPNKANGQKGRFESQTRQEKLARIDEREQRREAGS